MLNDRAELTGTIVALLDLVGVVTSEVELTGTLTIPDVSGGIPYTGEYHVTPSDQQQTLSTAGFLLAEDVVVDAIPSNYGLITWDGSTLTVS